MRPIYIVGLLVWIAACTTRDFGPEIAKLEKILETDYSPERADTLIGLYEAQAKQIGPKQTDAYIDRLMKAAALSKTAGQFKRSLGLYDQVLQAFPQHAKAPTAMFMKGFILENDLANIDEARKVYETFLKQYPNDPDYADDARNSLKYLGKSPEELIREFERKDTVSQQ